MSYICKIGIKSTKGLYLKLILPDPHGDDLHQFLNKTLNETQKVVETLNNEQDAEEPPEYTMSNKILTDTAQIKAITEAIQKALHTHTHLDLTDLPINVTELTLEAILVNKLMVAYYALLFILIVRIILTAVREK